MRVIKARALVEGIAEGEALVSPKPISFYGGVDPKSGLIVEKGHPLEGANVAGKVLVFPYGKGSTVGSYVIYELAKRRLAPSAMVNLESEIIIIAGCVLSSIPLVDRPEEDPFKIIKSGDYVKVIAEGKVAEIIVEDNDG